jgi:acyl-CoA thioesterase I
MQTISKLSNFTLVGLFLSILTPMTTFGEPQPIILAFGDSLTAGFGVGVKESYPSRLQDLLKKNGFPHKVINAGVSGDTTAGGLRRINWLMKQKPQIVILELGANDALRGLPIPPMESNLSDIIEICKKQNTKVLLVGMKAPPNYGEEYSSKFEETFYKLAKKFKTPLVPFLLEGVAAKREHNQGDGIHPTSEGYKIVVKTVWEYLKPML